MTKILVNARPNRLRWMQSAVALCCLSAAMPGLADVYALVEEDGAVRLSNVPDDPRYQLFLREPRELQGLRHARNPGDSSLRAPRAGEGVDGQQLDGRLYQGHVAEAARTYNLDPALIHAVIAAESNYNPNAVSAKGAVGLMQVLPETGQRYGVGAKQLTQPEINIRTGARYLADLLRLFGGDLNLALAGYNAGENVVIRYGNRVPPYAETQAYVPRVLSFYERLKSR